MQITVPKLVKIAFSMYRSTFIFYIIAKIYCNDPMVEDIGLALAGFCLPTWCYQSKDNRPFGVMIANKNDYWYALSKLVKLYHSWEALRSKSMCPTRRGLQRASAGLNKSLPGHQWGLFASFDVIISLIQLQRADLNAHIVHIQSISVFHFPPFGFLGLSWCCCSQGNKHFHDMIIDQHSQWYV